ncbi:MAG: HPt (histidine-containing phosphotransfer) domain-containing protein [Oceanicoccus sp.]|jgi:HPt (histidine-containing phosphotransfer) domain-containing protein
MSDWPENLPGLNLKQALSQLGGKKTLYVRLLGMFEASHLEDGNRIIEAAKQEDWTAVNEINHALKGVTGNLAADEIFKICTSIDHKLKDGNHDISEEIASIPPAMDTLLVSVKQAQLLPTD